MEAILKKAGVPCFQMNDSETFTLTESQECVVPDTLPDVEAIVHCSGSALIRSKDVSDGRVLIEANVPARVSFIGDDGSSCCVDVSIPFYVNAQNERITGESICIAQLTLRQLEPRILNPRKLSVRAELTVFLRVFAPGRIETALSPDDCAAHIHTREQSASVRCVICATEKTFVLTDEYLIPEGLPSPHEILSQNAVAVVQETKTVGTKLIVSGSVKSDLLYRSGEGALQSVSFQTSFSQIIEIDSETEGAQAELCILTSGMYYEILPGAEDRTVAMEVHLVMQAVVTENREIAFLSDAYSNEFSLQTERENREFFRFVRAATLREQGRAVFETPETVRTLIQCRAEPLGAVTDGAERYVKLRIVLCCMGEQRAFSIERTVTLTIHTESDGADSLCVCGISVQELQAQVSAEAVDLRFSVEVCVHFLERQNLECISAVSYDENETRDLDSLPTLVMLRADSGQSLWSLAKENSSTVEAILDANGLDTAGEEWEKLLLIPKAL